MTMPSRPDIAHFEPSSRGDCPQGVRTVSRQAVGPDHVRAIDNNLQVAYVNPARASEGFRIFVLHWRSPAANGYRFIQGPGPHGRVRRMTPAELVRPIERWPAGQVRRWRRGPSVDSDRPWTYARLAAYATKVGVQICGELKSNYFTRHTVAQQLVNTAKRTGQRPWFMALYSMPYCPEKCLAVRRAGGDFAVIFGTRQKDRGRFWSNVHAWPYHPTRVW